MAPANSSALFSAFARTPIHFERGEGCRLFTNEGEEYLDFAAGIAVNSLGHSHPHLVNALKTQAEQLWHVSNLYESPQQESLANRLCENSFAERVFFTNSGSESMECAFKILRRFKNGVYTCLHLMSQLKKTTIRSRTRVLKTCTLTGLETL